MPHDSELVILVHGLWLHGVTMVYMKRAIERCGYPVAAYSYPSVRLTLGQNAARLARFCAAQPHARIHFIADMFRCYHARADLFAPPFTADQIAVIGRGQRPTGPL